MLLFALSALAAPAWPPLDTPASRGSDGVNDAAVLIGIENYAWVEDVKGAGQNINDWEVWLRYGRGVPAGSLKLLRDKDAVPSDIKAALAEAAKAVKPGGTLWVVWVGHGAPGGTKDQPEALLLGASVRDTDKGIEEESVSRTEVETIAGTGKQAHTVLVLDTCFSGKGVDGQYVDGGGHLGVRAPASWTGSADLTVLAAAQQDEYAALLPGAERPAFSYLVLGALRGWGDADGDGVVKASEAREYALSMLRAVGVKQSPGLAGPDVALAKGKEAGPDELAMRAWRTGVDPGADLGGRAVSPSVSGGFGDLSLDVAEKLKSQKCDRDADAKGQAARDTKLAAAVKAAQAEATAAWAKLGPQAEACAKLTAAAERESCAKTVDAFVSRAEVLTVTLGAGTELVVTECGTREPAYAVVSQKVGVSEVSIARAAAAVLRKAPTVAAAPVKAGNWTSPTLGAMKWIPAGTFTMGSTSGDSDEKPHKVKLTKGYWMMEHEVTQGEWKAVMGTNPSYFSACGDSCPVEQVSWDDAVAFAMKVSARDGVTYRLPTEAEWEYAARGGRDVTYAGSNEVGAVAWYDGNGGKQTHAVCGKARNGYGLCDMSGNVWEWAADWYGDYSGAATDPTGAATGSVRVIRGGSWSDTPAGARVAIRFRYAPSGRGSTLGFRLVRSSP